MMLMKYSRSLHGGILLLVMLAMDGLVPTILLAKAEEVKATFSTRKSVGAFHQLPVLIPKRRRLKPFVVTAEDGCPT